MISAFRTKKRTNFGNLRSDIHCDLHLRPASIQRIFLAIFKIFLFVLEWFHLHQRNHIEFDPVRLSHTFMFFFQKSPSQFDFHIFPWFCIFLPSDFALVFVAHLAQFAAKVSVGLKQDPFWCSATPALEVSESGATILHCVIFYYIIWCYTSSTAQGRGGSFKNRKPIGRGWLLWIMDGRANPLMDRKVVGVVLFGVVAMLAVVISPQLLDVVWCSAVVVIVVVVV